MFIFFVHIIIIFSDRRLNIKRYEE